MLGVNAVLSFALFDPKTPVGIVRTGDKVGREMIKLSQPIFRFLRRCLTLFARVIDRAWSYLMQVVFRRRPPPRKLRSSGRSAPRSLASAHQTNQELREGEYLDSETLVYAIGDIHGRADLLVNLLDRIDQDATGFLGKVHLVFLGDYIDRGFQSRQVIEILLSDRLAPYQTHFLKGNHEDALLSFLSDPDFGPKWAAYGGRETMVSYGVKPPRSMTLNPEWETAHDDFLKRFPNAHQLFFRGLPTRVKIGGYGFVHAGMRPGRSFEDQNDYDLMWIRDEFLSGNAAFDVKVVHGHTPTDAPYNDDRRINVDTGAYFTGRLTAVKLTGESVEFIATQTQ